MINVLFERECEFFDGFYKVVSNLMPLKTESPQIINTTQYRTNRFIVRGLHWAELFIIALANSLSVFSLFFFYIKSCSRNLIYSAEWQSANFLRVSSSSCVWFSRKSHLYAHTDTHMYIQDSSSVSLLRRRCSRVFPRQRALFWNSWGRMA